MPTITEITQLRHEGKLNEAYQMAQAMMEETPGQWANSSMFWVLRDMVKQAMSEGNMAQAKEHFERLKALYPEVNDDRGIARRSINTLQRSLTPQSDELKSLGELSKSNPLEAYNKAVAIAGGQGQNIDESLHDDLGWIVYRCAKAKCGEQGDKAFGKLFYDYLALKTTRPSLLHSMMLGLAVNYSRQYTYFDFANYLKQWGVSLFRKEDFTDGTYEGKPVPSLLSRVCGRVSVAQTDVFDELSQVSGVERDQLIEMGCQEVFWKLYQLDKAEDTKTFWQEMERYEGQVMGHGVWHSRILWIATKAVTQEQDALYLKLLAKSVSEGLPQMVWEVKLGKDQKAFPALAVQMAKKSFELLRNSRDVDSFKSLLPDMIKLFDQLDQHQLGDVWTARMHARLLNLNGDSDEALMKFRSLVPMLSDKYYFWQEMARSVKNNYALRLGMQLKAFELEKSEELRGHLRLEMAYTYYHLDCYDQASEQIMTYMITRSKLGRRAHPRMLHLYVKVVAPMKMGKLKGEDHAHVDDAKMMADAMDYVYSDCIKEKFVVVDRYMAGDKYRVVFANDKHTVSVSPRRFGLDAHIKNGTVVEAYIYEQPNDEKIVDIEVAADEKWSILPDLYGYVDHVNEAKHIAHICSPCGAHTPFAKKMVFFDKQQKLKAGDFVMLQAYEQKDKNEDPILKAVHVRPCDKAKALTHFWRETVAVDDVNEKKGVFHVVMNKLGAGCVVRFQDTSLRPQVGDFLSLVYCRFRSADMSDRFVAVEANATQEVNENLIKTFSGNVSFKQRKADGAYYAFVDHAYVSAALIDKHKLGPETTMWLKVRAVASDNGKWKAYEILEVN